MSSLFLKFVFIRFIAENPRSHVAVETGVISPMFASFASCGYIVDTEGLMSECITSVVDSSGT